LWNLVIGEIFGSFGCNIRGETGFQTAKFVGGKGANELIYSLLNFELFLKFKI